MAKKPHLVPAPPTYNHLLPDTFRAHTTVNIPGRGWALVDLVIGGRGAEIVECKMSEPDMKPLVMDNFKRAMVKLWRDING